MPHTEFCMRHLTFSSAFCVSVSAASSPDEAVISGNYDGIEPIPTEKPEDKPVKHGKGFSSGDYALFYTQTTFLALLEMVKENKIIAEYSFDESEYIITNIAEENV